MPQVGYRFYPTEQELLEFYLFNKITQNPLLYEDGDIPVIDCDLYGSNEPSVIWEMYGGNRLLKGQDLYFFTRLKKLSPKAKNFYRKIASGAWQGEDGSKPVEADGSDQILGFKRRFRYENKTNHKDNGGWIMHEFTINSSLLGDQYSYQDIVLCRIKKNESGQKKERANLGKKQRNSSGGRASGNKRKLKEVATPNSNGDQGDEIAPNKRLRAGQEVVLVQQNYTPCSSNTMQAVEYEGEIMESLPEDSTTFDHHDEGVWAVEEAIDLPCSNTNMQIVEVGGEMESLPEDFDSFEVEEYSSLLDQILEHDGSDCNDDEGIQCKQLRGAEEGAPLVQQNQPTDLPCPNSTIPIMELPVEALAPYDDEDVFSTLDEITKFDCIEDHDEKCVQSKQLRGLEEDEALDSAEFKEFLSGVDQVLDQLFPGWNQ